MNPKSYAVITIIVVSLNCGLSCCAAADSPSERFASKLAKQVADSSYATIGVLSPNAKPIRVQDRDWAKRFSDLLRRGVYEPELHVFAESPPITFFDKSGAVLVSIELLPDTTLRVKSEDYEMDSKTFLAIRDLVRSKAN